MKPLLALTLIVWLPTAPANHANDFGIDICTTYADRLPPGLTRLQLPEPASQGALLLDSHCTQCHNLPAPDRHNASEWHDLTEKMFMLMEVSHRFGGIMGKVRTLDETQKSTVRDYLQRHGGIQPAAAASDARQASWPMAAGVMLPFFALISLGLFRWWRGGHA